MAPVPTGEFNGAQQAEIDRAIRNAETVCRYEFSVYVGAAQGEPRAYARQLHAALANPARSVMLLVDPAARRLEVAVVALSVVTRSNGDQYARQIEQLSTLLPADTALWIGGYTTNVFDGGSMPANCTLFSTIDDYLLRLDILQSQRD